jgi:putative membrane protein
VVPRSGRAPLSRLRSTAVFAWLAGLGLIVLLIAAQGAAEVAGAFELAGWSALALGLAHLGTLLADTLGWRALLWPPHRRPLSSLLVKRWIGMSINGLLPVAQVGGEFVRARLLARSGTPAPTAGASVVVDLTAGLVTQIAFAALGIVLLVQQLGHRGELLDLTLGLALFGLLLLAFALIQRRGLFALLARPVERLARGPAWRALIGNAAALDAEVALRYRRPRALALCAAWRALGWLAGGVEIWLAFLVLGQPVGLAEAIVLESIGQAARSAGFRIPGGLGVQEGGILISGVWLGLAPEVVLAAALLKRARELVYGVPGLIAWSCLDGPGRGPLQLKD